MHITTLVWLLLMVTICTRSSAAGSTAAAPQSIAQGRAIYERACAWCHGKEGTGDGPQAMFNATFTGPRPRNFREEPFKFRTTPSGELPTDYDLFRTITNGIPGYMPPFAGLPAETRWQLVAYVKTLNPDFAHETPVTLAIGWAPIPPTPESVARGRTMFFQFECHSCHGRDGRGMGDFAHSPELTDSRGLFIQPADLTAPASFKNGASLRDIARSILTGLDGTPMPSYLDTMEHPEDVWHLVNYIVSLSRTKSP